MTDRERFTEHVMARVREASAEHRPGLQPARAWLAWPRLGMALASSLAGILLVIGLQGRTTGPQSAQVASQQPSQDEAPIGRLVLAESSPSDDQWLEQTLELLEEFDDSSTDATAGNEEDWLQELQMLDQEEISSSS